MSDGIIVALITGGVTLIGTIITVLITSRQTVAALDKQSAVSDEKIHREIDVIKEQIKTLSEQVEKHNRVVERTYNLEARVDVLEAFKGGKPA